MFHIIEHLNEPIKLIKEFKQYLKPDGELIIEIHNAMMYYYQYIIQTTSPILLIESPI